MSETILIGLASILILGISTQWFAWQLKLPAIVLLLLVGIISGPVTGMIDPDFLFGDLLLPIISISVAIILFEGGLSLKFKDLAGSGKVVRNLVTIGTLITFFIASLASYFVLELSLLVSLLLSSVLVVTGPTVIIPLLRQVRLNKPVGMALRWEGIIIDPIGAMLAVLVFEAIILTQLGEAQSSIFLILGKTIFFGGVMGVGGGLLLVLLLRKFWIPDYLQETVTLMIVVLFFTLANHFQAESGLLAVTVMGILLANSHGLVVGHIVAFKENLQVLLISTVFIILSARLNLIDLLSILSFRSLLFLLILIFIARPLSVIISSIGSDFSWPERFFISWIAPRGIVAAAIASIFALRVETYNIPDSSKLVPLTFLVIISTVMLYGLSANKVSQWLGVAQPSLRGVLIVGANKLAVKIAKVLINEKVPVLMVDTNKQSIVSARDAGIPTIQDNILSERVLTEVELSGVGKMLALTSSEEANLLSAMEYSHLFGRSNIFQIVPEGIGSLKQTLREKYSYGRQMFSKGMTYTYLMARITAGAKIVVIKIDKSNDLDIFLKKHRKAVPMFVINKDNYIRVSIVNQKILPKMNERVICLV